MLLPPASLMRIERFVVVLCIHEKNGIIPIKPEDLETFNQEVEMDVSQKRGFGQNNQAKLRVYLKTNPFLVYTLISTFVC